MEKQVKNENHEQKMKNEFDNRKIKITLHRKQIRKRLKIGGRTKNINKPASKPKKQELQKYF